MEIEDKLKKTGNKSYEVMFSSIQLLGFTVLYYNFNYNTEKMTQLNKKMIELNGTILKDVCLNKKSKEKIEKIWGIKLEKKVKEFPYRAKIHIIGGLPKGGMKFINMAIIKSDRAIEEFLILIFSALLEKEKKFGKVQMDCFYENLKSNAMNYANGMKDEFIVQYFKNQINLTVEFG